MRLLYLEDDSRDVELLQLICEQTDPDCEVTAAMTRVSFVAELKCGHFDGILSDSGLHDLTGSEAVTLARSLAPKLPYVFFCGTISDAKRAELLAAKPDGIFAKDRPGDIGLAIGLLRKLGRNGELPKRPIA